MLFQVLSVVGALMVLTAYALIQSGIWRELDAGYLALNIIGSLLLGVVAIEDQRVGFILLEFAWAGLGLIGVVRAIKARKTADAVL
jgi:drug/metabolite transporter (DMT)-like permease